MIAKGKKLIALLLAATMLLMNILTAAAADERVQSGSETQYPLTVEVTGEGTVEVTGENVVKSETVAGEYMVNPDSEVSVTIQPGEGYEKGEILLNGKAVEETFKMPEEESVLKVTMVPEAVPADEDIIKDSTETTEKTVDPEQTEEKQEETSEQRTPMYDVDALNQILINDIGVGLSTGTSKPGKMSRIAPTGQWVDTAVLVPDIGRIDGVMYHPDGTWDFVSSWNEGFLGLTNGEWAFCADPNVNFSSGAKLTYNMSDFYNAQTIKTIGAMFYYFDRYIDCGGLTGYDQYLMKQTIVWSVLNSVNGWCSGVTLEYGNGVYDANGHAVAGHVNDMIWGGAEFASQHWQEFECDAKILKGSGQDLMQINYSRNENGSISVSKTSAIPGLTANNSCYSLEKAEYGVYRNSGCTDYVATMVTDANGSASLDKILTGNYWIKETKAPKGYALNQTAYPIAVSSGQTTTLNVKDYPQSDPVLILLGKIDKETNSNKPSGSYSLENAEFTVKYYDVISDTDPALAGKKPIRQWVLKTREDGKTAFVNSLKVSGDDFFRNSTGAATLPIGTITIQETKAPIGYLINKEVFVRKITQNGNAEMVETYNAPTVPETPQKGIIRLQKVDKETGGAAQGTATREGAVYEVFDSNGKVVDTLTTNKEGKVNSKKLPLGKYSVREKSASYGFLVDETTYDVTLSASNRTDEVFYVDVVSKETPQKGIIRLQKIDKETGGAAQGTATREGAVYEVFDSNGKVVDTLTTNKEGKVNSKKLPLGKYSVKEKSASYGFLVDETTYNVTLSATNKKDEAFYVDVVSKETPQKIKIEIHKLDSETSKNEPQGAASLKDAVYEVLNAANEVVDTLVTDKNGKAVSKELPLASYTVREKKSSNGYLVDGQLYKVDGKAKNKTDRVFTYEVTSKEDIIRGNVEIIKLRENEDEENDTLQGIKGVEFTFTSDTTGKVVKVITTDKNGFATTADPAHSRGGLVFDTYTVTETKCPTGLKPIEPFKVTISQEGVTLKGIYKEDKLIVSPVTVVKVDKSTGKVIPIANTEFRLLDADKNPITMTTYYPNKEVHKTFKTDVNGQFTFPDKLKYGTYYLEELNAPEGYLKGELLKFEVTKGAAWENPLVIEYADDNAMGQIELTKLDVETKELLNGATFEIRAAEDIVTPDGTIRLNKGDLADTITTADGKAVSRGLFLGKYKVVETKQPDGYILPEETWNVELVYADQTTKVVIEKLEVTNVPTEIQLIKTDKDSGEVMKGVTFKIWNKAMESEDVDPEMGEKPEYVTDENGVIDVKRLVPGTYCVQEVKTLPGYVLDDIVREITIDKDGRIDGEEVGKIRVGNDYTKVEFTKQDITTDKEIEGGTYKVTDSEGNVIDEWTGTGKPHRIDKLVIGQEYSFEEVIAPDGYLITNAVKFTVKDTSEVQPVVMKDENAMGKIRIQKTDSETKKPISGTEFEIRAAEDIVTPEGTVRLKEGEVADEIKTEKGVAESKKLFLGKYTVTETKQTAGYVLTEKTWNVELTYKDQDTEVVTESVGIRNQPTHLIIKKKAEDTEKPLKGVTFQIWNKASEEEPDSEMSVKQDYVTNKKGKINLAYLIPGTYCVQETKTLPGYVLDEEIHEITIDEKGLINGESTGVLELTNVKTKLIGTTATDQDTGKHEAVPKKDTIFVDKVEFKDLQVGQEYIIKGTLMNQETGEPLLINEKKVTAEKKFTAETSEGIEEVVFTFDSSSLKGQSIVVFEKVYIEEIEILAHEDINDKGQTIEFPDTKIRTTATDQDTGTHEGIAKKEAVITDKVEYKNAIAGQEYTLKGTLMNQETEEPLLINGKEVTAEKTFVAEKENGNVEMTFTFDASGLKGQSVVVFEKMYVKETEVATHENINDKGQTVEFPDTKIQTTAKDKDTGTHEAVAKEKTTIIDTVMYENVIVGQEYTVKGVLMDKATEKPLEVGEKKVTAEKTFVAEKENGNVDVTFTFDASGLKGQSVVVFEKMYVKEAEIAAHENINDKGQTIEFPEGKIGTKARDKDTGTQEAVTNGKTTIIDTVMYENLIVGQEYTVKGVLMDKETEQPLESNGTKVIAEKTFVTESKKGAVELEFTFDASALDKHEMVVFERLYADEAEVAAHADINDKDQTVKIKVVSMKKTAKTGDSGGIPMALLLLLSCSAMAGAGAVYYRNGAKKKREE